jgi:hypothetical protein
MSLSSVARRSASGSRSQLAAPHSDGGRDDEYGEHRLPAAGSDEASDSDVLLFSAPINANSEEGLLPSQREPFATAADFIGENGEMVDVEPSVLTKPRPPLEPPPNERLRLVGTIIKSFIGSGVLFLPKAFANGGWLFSIVSMAIMAAITNLCILRLVQCRTVVVGE